MQGSSSLLTSEQGPRALLLGVVAVLVLLAVALRNAWLSCAAGARERLERLAGKGPWCKPLVRLLIGGNAAPGGSTHTGTSPNRLTSLGVVLTEELQAGGPGGSDMARLAALVQWAAQQGVGQLFLYDPMGFLQRHRWELEKAVELELEGGSARETGAGGGGGGGSGIVLSLHVGWPAASEEEAQQQAAPAVAAAGVRQRKPHGASSGGGNSDGNGGSSSQVQQQRQARRVQVVLLSAADAVWPLEGAAVDAAALVPPEHPSAGATAAPPPAAFASEPLARISERGSSEASVHAGSMSDAVSEAPSPHSFAAGLLEPLPPTTPAAAAAGSLLAEEVFGLRRPSADPTSAAARLFARPSGEFGSGLGFLARRSMDVRAPGAGRRSVDMRVFGASRRSSVDMRAFGGSRHSVELGTLRHHRRSMELGGPPLPAARASLEVAGYRSALAKEADGCRSASLAAMPDEPPPNQWPLQSSFRPRASLEKPHVYHDAAGRLEDALDAPAELRARLGQAAGPLAAAEPDLVMVFGEAPTLAGYPPWAVRGSEIYHAGSLEGLQRAGLERALQKFLATKQRFGA